MGAASSTEQKKPSTKVFLPSTPTQFSAGLISKMDTSIESDYTRSQYTEKYIQDRVAEELEKIETESSAALTQAFADLKAKANSSTPSDGGDDLSIHSTTLRSQVQELAAKLDAARQRHALDTATAAARASVTTCLQQNSSKPLKCYDEYEAFKASVKDYEQKLL